jgi:hypoxanthine phosphoribosyltransferase
MEAKEFISADGLLEDSFGLAKKIFDSGYEPEVLVCLWRGGTPVGIAVHEYLLYKGIETNHVAIKAASYTGPGARNDVEVENIDAFVGSLPPDSRVLIIDDIYDTGFTLKKVYEQFSRRTRNIKTATLYHKLGPQNDGDGPDFCLRETDNWIIFPHELIGLSE